MFDRVLHVGGDCVLLEGPVLSPGAAAPGAVIEEQVAPFSSCLSFRMAEAMPPGN